MIDTLGQGAVFGLWTSIGYGKYPFNVRAKTNTTLHLLSAEFLEELRNDYYDLDEALNSLENEVKEGRKPHCDFQHYSKPRKRKRSMLSVF